MTPPGELAKPPDHDERMAVARRVAEWELGDAGWAGQIVGAYLNPEPAQHYLDTEQADDPRS